MGRGQPSKKTLQEKIAAGASSGLEQAVASLNRLGIPESALLTGDAAGGGQVEVHCQNTLHSTYPCHALCAPRRPISRARWVSCVRSRRNPRLRLGKPSIRERLAALLSGTNYERLRAIKRQNDPDGLCFVHHGVGSEEWSGGGFVRRAANQHSAPGSQPRMPVERYTVVCEERLQAGLSGLP
jgi:hypothetical protein